jgi:iron complex transport system substrate-binding protein
VSVTQNQCDVCAVSYADVEAAAREVLGDAVAIVSLAPHRLADVWDDVGRVALALDRAAAGRRVVADADERLAAVAARVRGRARPLVACIEWIDPLMMAANWTPELVAIAGGVYPFAEPGAESRTTPWDALANAEPDAVVLMPCGFPVAQTRRELSAVRARSEWRRLRAVANGRAWIVDGNAYFNRPGPRLVDSAEILAALLHPDGGIPPPPDAFEAIA